MSADSSRTSAPLRPRLTARIATAAIAATLAGGLLAMAAASTGTVYRTSGEANILADVGWNAPHPKAAP